MKEIGLIGLGAMGRNLAYNFLSHGIKVVGYNRTTTLTEEINSEERNGFHGAVTLEELVQHLPKPRQIFLMVTAGETIDKVLSELCPLLDEGDIILDGGNSFFEDTNRRVVQLAQQGIVYYGVGLSGGTKGARIGPSLMPGGDKEKYHEVQDILEIVAAKYHGEACCSYIGPEGSGHYVKMVHNGIEYADMQLIVESYLLLKTIGKFNNQQISEIFDNWNQGKSKSYLLEITVKILREKEENMGLYLIDLIQDKASHKGTGKWTAIESMKQEENAAMISGAYLARLVSNDKRRLLFTESLPSPKGRNVDPIIFTEELKKAYYLGKVMAYAQGFDLMKSASEKFSWNLNLANIASIFRAGCIIQSEILEEIRKSYQQGEELKTLIEYPLFIKEVQARIQSLRVVVSLGIQYGLPLPLFTSAQTSLDQLRSPQVGANLIQAQRDFFGAHQFRRIDQEGDIHYEWEKED
ncbi:MAG: NADP-dependent phosphogluconate dehydrogenase [Anaerorhabdus sp.]